MNKKQLIMEKALELFAKQGFEATSVQQITDYCGISKGAFYLSFKSKDELILALIDHFMQQMIIDIDYTVNHVDSDSTLYHFFHTTFQAFVKHTDFVKLLMKEQNHSINNELLNKMRYYNQKTDQTLLSMIEKVYDESIQGIKYDLVITIKGLMNGYSTFLLFNKLDLDVDLISRSLVEKTNIIAKHMTTPFITEEYVNWFQNFQQKEVSEEYLLLQLSSTIEVLEDSLEKESLLLLKEQLKRPSQHIAIIQGLIGNIRNHPQCRFLAHQLTNFFKANPELENREPN